jgi:Ca2+-binding EF-hand superfamily protein
MGLNISKKSLTDDDLEMLQKLSKMPKEEIVFWYDHFKLNCPSGKLNKEQFVEYYKLFRKNENVEEIAKHCFSAFDLDKNGFVDFGEFLIAYVATTGTDLREKLKYAFAVYDQDNNKVLEENEIRLVLKAMFKLLNVDESTVNFEKCLENIMNSLDENKDSKISKGEFIDGIINDPYLYALLSPFS